MPMHDWSKVDANTFHNFHVGFLVAIRNALNHGILPKDYYARADQTAPPIVPDVLTLHRPPSKSDSPGQHRAAKRAGVAVATLEPPRVKHSGIGRELQRARPAERRISIRHNSGHRLIAVIEVISKSNKDREGIVKFASKAIELLRDGVHFMFIDSYPPGPRDPLGLHAYLWQRLVHVKGDTPMKTPCLTSYAARSSGEFASYLQPVAVGGKLTPMPLFLTSEQYVNLPLEDSYMEAWHGLAEADQELVKL